MARYGDKVGLTNVDEFDPWHVFDDYSFEITTPYHMSSILRKFQVIKDVIYAPFPEMVRLDGLISQSIPRTWGWTVHGVIINTLF